MRYTLAALNARFVHSCPALFSVRNELTRHLPGCTTSLLQFTIDNPYFATLLTLTGQEPEAIFFSVYIWNADFFERLVHDLAKTLPDCPIILGGPQVSHGPQQEWPGQCTIIRGEIEGLPEGFYHDLKQGRLQREYTALPPQSFPSPYRKEDFPITLHNRYVYYESTRGCPFACSYCLSSTDQGIRQKDLKLVQQELAVILPHTPKSLRFVDRTFNTDRKRALALWQFLAEHTKETQCHFEILPDLFDEEMFAFLQTVPAGLFGFEIGLQTTNPDSLTAIHRTVDLEKALSNIARLVSLDTVHIHLDLILGLPFETVESFRQSFNTAFSLNPHYIQMGLLKVLPGTEMHRQKEEFGLLTSGSPPYAVMATRWMEHAELRRLFWFGQCAESFFNNPYFRAFFQYVRENEPDPFDLFDKLLHTCRAHGFFDLAPTQKLMTQMLCALAQGRPDRDLVLEILRYDWLRCGHRFLPDCLQTTETLQETKKHLRERLPQNYPDLFDHVTRSEFLRQTTFSHFSPIALEKLGFPAAPDSTIAFLPARSQSIFKHCKTVLLSA